MISKASRNSRRQSIRGLKILPLLMGFFWTSHAVGTDQEQWKNELLASLCRKYLGEEGPPSGVDDPVRLDRLARTIGQRLAASGTSEVPAEDIAVLALLQSGPAGTIESAARAQGAQPQQAAETAAEATEQTEPAQGAESSVPTKGEEGLARALERFSDLPVSERMLITGDVTAGVQAANTPGGPNLNSIVGRTRMNFVLRALPSQDERWEEGFFFLQMMSAGGAFDSSLLGGPTPFGAFNDVATDRSPFNDSKLRGNLFINKAYYEQRFRFGDTRFEARAGLLDMSDYFDTNLFANNEARQFINSSFVNGTGYQTGIVAPGIVGEYHRPIGTDWLEGVVFRLGSAFSSTDRAFVSPLWTGEVEFQTRRHGYQGHWRLGTTVGNVAGAGSVRGFHISMDQWLASDVGLFARYAVGNTGPGALNFGPVRQAYSGGVQWRFVDDQDRVSAWAVGFSQAFGIVTAEPLSSEKVLETYYRWQLSQNFALTPDFQLVLSSGGRSSRGTQAVLGMRMHFVF